MSNMSIHGSGASAYNGSGFGGGPQGMPPLQREQPGIPNDTAVMRDMTNLQRAGNNQRRQAAAAKQLIGDTMGQENAQGQLAYVTAVENGSVKSDADVQRLNLQLKRDALVPGGPGPITLAVDDALAKAASQGLPAQGPPHESPASAVIGSSTYAQNQTAPSAQQGAMG